MPTKIENPGSTPQSSDSSLEGMQEVIAPPLDNQQDYLEMRDSFLNPIATTYYQKIKSKDKLLEQLGKSSWSEVPPQDLIRLGLGHLDLADPNYFQQNDPLILPNNTLLSSPAKMKESAALLDEGFLISLAYTQENVNTLADSALHYDEKTNEMFIPGAPETEGQGYPPPVKRMSLENDDPLDPKEEWVVYKRAEVKGKEKVGRFPLPYVKYEVLENEIRCESYRADGLQQVLTAESMGEVAFEGLKAYLTTTEAQFSDSDGHPILQGYIPRKMSGYFIKKEKYNTDFDPARPLGLKGFLRHLPYGYFKEEAIPPNFGAYMAEIARRGWLKKASHIDFAKAEVTFADKQDGLALLDLIYTGDTNDFINPNVSSIEIYMGLRAKTEKENGKWMVDLPDQDGVPITKGQYARGMFEMLRGGEGGVIGKKDYDGVRRRRFYNDAIITAFMHFADWEDEAQYLKDAGISADNFRYYVLVKGNDGVKAVEIEGPPNQAANPMAGGAQGPNYIKNYDDVTRTHLGSHQIPEASDLQEYLDDFGAVGYLGDIMIFNDTNFFFITDKGVPIVRAPRFYEKFTTSQYGMANKDEFGNAEIKYDEKNEPIEEQTYFTFDESMMVADFFNGVLGDKDQWLYYDDRCPSKTITNPITGEYEDAYVHRLNLPTEKMQEAIASIDKQLTDPKLGAAAYPADYWFADEEHTKYWFSKPYELGRVANIMKRDKYDPELAWRDPLGRDDLFVTVGRYKISRKRAAYLANVFRLVIKDKPNSGLSATKMQEVSMKMQEDLSVKLNKDSQIQMVVLFAIVSPLIGSIIGGAVQYVITKKLQKDLMAEGVGEDRAKELAKKLKKGPPDFLKPLVKSIKDIQPYEATDEREQKIKLVMESIAKSQPVLLLGESAQGKSLIMEEVQRRLLLPKQEALDAKVPPQLAGRKLQIKYLDPDMMEAGTKYVGQFAEKMAMLKVYMARNPDTVIFADEWHKFIGLGEAGESKGSGINDFPNKIKEDLARKRWRFVAATTLAEYQMKFIDSRYDASRALERRFKKISLDTYTPDQVKSMLKNLTPKLLEKYSILRVGITEGEGGSLRSDMIDRIVDQIDRTLPPERKNELMVKSIEFIQDLADRIMREYLNMDVNATPDNMLTDDPDIIKILTQREPLVQRLSIVEARLKELNDAGIVGRIRNKFEIGRLENEKDELQGKIDKFNSSLLSLGGDPRLIPVYEKRLGILEKSLKSLQDILDAANTSRLQRAENFLKLESLEERYDEILEERAELKLKLKRIVDGREFPVPIDLETEKKSLHTEIERLSRQALDLKTEIQILALKTGRDKLSKSYKEELNKEVVELQEAISETSKQLDRLRTSQQEMVGGKGYRGVTIDGPIIDRFWSDIMSSGLDSLGGAEEVEKKASYKRNSETIDKILKRIGRFNQDLKPVRGGGDPFNGYRLLGFMDLIGDQIDRSDETAVKKELERILREKLQPFSGELSGYYSNRLDYILKQVEELPITPDTDKIDKIRSELQKAQLYSERPDQYTEEQLLVLLKKVQDLEFPDDASKSVKDVKEYLLKMYAGRQDINEKRDLLQFIQGLHKIYELKNETQEMRRDRITRTNSLCQEFIFEINSLSADVDVDKALNEILEKLFRGLMAESKIAEALGTISATRSPTVETLQPNKFTIPGSVSKPDSFATEQDYKDFVKKHLEDNFEGVESMFSAGMKLDQVIELILKRLGNPVVSEGEQAKKNPNYDRDYELLYSEWKALEEAKTRPEYRDFIPILDQLKLSLFMDWHLKVQETRKGGPAYKGSKSFPNITNIVSRLFEERRDMEEKKALFERAAQALQSDQNRRSEERRRERERRAK